MRAIRIEGTEVFVVNAGEIVSALFYSKSLMSNKPPNSFVVRNIEAGDLVHKRLGYSQPNIYSRFYFLKEISKWLLIKGAPDKVVLPYVVELKTYNPKNKDTRIQIATVQLQVYSFLTGLSDEKVVLYNNEIQKIDYETSRKYNPALFKLSLQTFWEITKKITKLVKNIQVNFADLMKSVEPGKANLK